MEHYPHKSGIGLMEPIVQVGFNVCCILNASREYRKVIWLEPIPPFQCLDIGALALQTQSARTQAANLQLFDGEFAQYRWFPIDPVQVRLFSPQASGRYLLRNIQPPVDPTIVERDPCLHLTEFFVWEDYSPWFEAMNYSDYAITAARIIAQGIRFVTDPLAQSVIDAIKQDKVACTYVVCAGNSGMAR